MFIFEQRGTEREQGRREKEGDTESEIGSRLWAVSTEFDTGLEPVDRDIMTWAKVRRSTDWATQAPHMLYWFYSLLLSFGDWETPQKGKCCQE